MDMNRSVGRRWLLALAVASSAVTAVLYILVGIGALDIGEPAPDVTRGTFAFGLTVGGAFAVVAFMLAGVQQRWLWISVGLMDAIVIAVYFATSATRVPPFELPGLVIQGVQLLALVAAAILAVIGPDVPDPATRGPHSPNNLG
jgi:hypothetical protein